jgi:hypothetical protein
MPPKNLSASAAAAVHAVRRGIATSERAAYRASHRKYVGPPAAGTESNSPIHPDWERFHDLQAVLP